MTPTRKYQLAAAGLLVAVVGIAIYLRSGKDDTPSKTGTGTADDPLQRALDVLERSTDFPSCRAALQHFNAHFTKNPDRQAPPLSEAQLARLRTEMGLDEAELAEVTAPHFTALDAHYLEYCYLLRDAVKSLDLRGEGDHRATPEKEAEAALVWVVANVRLELPPLSAYRAEFEDHIDLHFALIRGYGTPTARALIFLSLLQQIGVDGCLLAAPGKPGEPTRYWACGVLGSEGRLFVFDLRMGIPLPSADGGIATLRELLQKDSPVLKQLDFGPEQRHDITSEQAAASEIHLAPLFGALAPRMQPLQEALAGGDSRVRLAPDVWKAEQRFAEALRAAGVAKPSVRLVPKAARMQRGFFSDKEGGSDRLAIRDLAIRSLAMIHRPRLYVALPLEGGVRPEAIEQFDDQPRKMIFDEFEKQFYRFFLGAGESRDLVLRGRYLDAARQLDKEGNFLSDAVKARDVLATPERIIAWFKEAEQAFGSSDPSRFKDQLLAVLNKHRDTIGALAIGTAAQVQLAQVNHLQTLIAQARAERMQFLADNFPSEVSAQDLADLDNLWDEVIGAWKGFFKDFGGAAEARNASIQRARAQEALARTLARRVAISEGAEKTRLDGEARTAREQARRFWIALGMDRKDLQSLAARYRAELLSTSGKRTGAEPAALATDLCLQILKQLLAGN